MNKTMEWVDRIRSTILIWTLNYSLTLVLVFLVLMSRSQHFKSRFEDSWFINPKYNLRISNVETNKTKAHCKLCHKTFDLTLGGFTALDSH